MTSSAHNEPTAKPHVCVVAHNAFSAVFPQEGRAVGGAETGAWTIARGLNGTGRCRVSFYLRSSRPLPAVEVEGIRIVRLATWFPALRRRVSESVERRAGFPWIRIVKLRLALLWELPFLLTLRPFRPADLQPFEPDPVLRNLSPDAFVIFGASADASSVVATAEQLNVPVMLMLQSNVNLPASGPEVDAYGESTAVVHQTLQKASAIVCQSQFQQERLNELCGREAIVIPPPINLDEWPSSEKEGDYVLWIGRSDLFHKRPHLLIELARRCPEIPFLMVMNRQDPEVYAEILNELPDNVVHREYVPFDQIHEVFDRACVFVSTGNPEYEGFPNVLLQAAATGLPIVSMHDFDTILERSRSGVSCGEELNLMAEHVKDYWSNRPASLASRSDVRAWLVAHHSQQKTCERLLKAIELTLTGNDSISSSTR